MDRFSKNTQMSNLTKTLMVGAEFFRVDGRAGGQVGRRAGGQGGQAGRRARRAGGQAGRRTGTQVWRILIGAILFSI